MLNFLANVFQERSTTRNTCSTDMDTIQGCLNCDGECLYSCDAVCSNSCQAETQDPNSGPGTCNTQCTGTCFSTASIMGIK